MNNLEQVIQKIKQFVSKYYTNRLIRGLIIFVTIFIILFLFFSLTEYYARLGTMGRTIIFFTAISISSLLFVNYIFIPIIKLLKIGKTMTIEQAAVELTHRMPELKDNLLNLIDLKNHKVSNEQINLLNAAIEQKSLELSIIDFRKAIDFRINYKYLRIFIPILLIFILLVFFKPTVITESAKRIIDYKTEYIAPSKVRMILKNSTLQVKRGNDLEIEFQSVGEINPFEVELYFAGKKLLMRELTDKDNSFAYKFQNLNNGFDFYIKAGDFTSKKYTIDVLNPPLITEFALSVIPPKYTAQNDTTYRNIGDLNVPYGSKLTWNFKAISVENIIFKKDSNNYELKPYNKIFEYSTRILKNINYGVKPVNKNFPNENFINYSITIIPDLFPQIIAEQKADSSMLSLRYFRGFIQDDYGITKLNFKYTINSQNNASHQKKYKAVNIPVGNSPGRQEFFYSFDFSVLNPQPNQVIEYYFEVFDNDAVAGAKSSKSKVFYYRVPSLEEQLAQFDNVNEKSQSSILDAMELTKEINKSIRDFQKSSIDNNKSDWENKQFLEELQSKQEQLNKAVQQAKQEIEKAKELAKMNNQDMELLEKLKELEKMTEELLTDEIKELMQQLNELMQNYDEKKMQEFLQKQQNQQEDLNKTLDRNLELLKRFKVEQKTEKIANELNKLAEQSEKLAEKTKENKTSDEDLIKEQNEIKDKFEKLSKEYEKTLDENKELEKPFDMQNMEHDKQQIQSEFQKTDEMLQKSKNKKAAKSQKSNANNIRKMAQKMQSMMQNNAMEMNEEDMEQLQNLVQDLLTLSFEQELNMDNMRNLSASNPKYFEYGEVQINLKNDYKVIKDSLYALSRRMFALSNLINKETKSIDENFEYTYKNVVDQRSRNVRNGQNKIMESFNNLALILSNLVDSMQEQMQQASSGEGKGKKQKQGGSKPSFGNLKKQQQGLKKQLENMIKQMQQNKGNKKGQMPSSKQLADMLARQEIFRQKMQEMKSKHSLQQNTKKLLDEISKLSEENEKQIINKQITPELLKRQQLIETKLLEAENAENKRKKDNKRESKTAKETKYESPEDFFENDKTNSSIKENLNKNSVILTPFYRKTFDKYNNSIKKQ